MINRILSLFLAFVLLVSLAGCGTPPASINYDAVLYHLLNDVTFDTELLDTGDLAYIYFPEIPQGSTVRQFIGSGYFADELVAISVSDASSVEKVRNSLQSHVSQIRNQFQNYIPDEVKKIDEAIIWESGTYLFLIITKDTETAEQIFKNASSLEWDPSYTLPTVTEPTEPPTVPPETTVPPTEPPETTVAPTEPPATTEPPPVIPQIISQSGHIEYYPNGIIKVDNAAYEPYIFIPQSVRLYAQQVSAIADMLKGHSNVYCLPIPTAVGVTFPDDVLPNLTNYYDQNEAIIEIFDYMSENVIGVNCHGNLMLHRDEYLYYRTDYHWNGPAAYYAYETFCQVKGVEPYTMEMRKEERFEDFKGLLYQVSSNRDPDLGESPDTVIAYQPYFPNVTMKFGSGYYGTLYSYPIIQNGDILDTGSKYLCYAAGDQPFAVFTNPDVTDGSVCIVIKESYGNVLMSYLVDHYSTVYELDYRYWEGGIAAFAKQVGATDVIFANNLTMISSVYLVGMLSDNIW